MLKQQAKAKDQIKLNHFALAPIGAGRQGYTDMGGAQPTARNLDKLCPK